MDGFKPDGLECIPNSTYSGFDATLTLTLTPPTVPVSVYRCPYGDPVMSGTRPQPCDVNESGGDQCPAGYECMYPPDPYRPKFTTLSGVEKGYCCPLIPDLDHNILFQEQCYYGDWVSPFECPPSTHVYAFAISTAPLCCPKPCRPNYSSSIINGQCVEGVFF